MGLGGGFCRGGHCGRLGRLVCRGGPFHHPLGLPIPHAAIIPRNKVRIAAKLAAFVRDQFLETEAIVGLVRRLDPAGTVAVWLQKKENAELLGRHLLVVVQDALHFVDDIRVRDALRETLRRQLGQINLAQMAGQILDTLTREHRHQELLEDGIQRLSRWLDQGETQQDIAETLREVLKRAYPTLFAWMGAVVDLAVLCQNLAENLVSASNKLLQEIAADPERPRRQAFAAWVDDFIQRLKPTPVSRSVPSAGKGRFWIIPPCTIMSTACGPICRAGWQRIWSVPIPGSINGWWPAPGVWALSSPSMSSCAPPSTNIWNRGCDA